jgi:ketosteroid isomerase-like protein
MTAAAPDNVEITRRWWAGFNEHGMPPLELCDESIEIENPPGFPVHGPYSGHAGVRKWMDDVFEVIDEPRTEVEEAIDAGDGETVFMKLRTLGRFRHTQMEAVMPWATVIKLRHGKFLKAQGYLSSAEAREAAGLAE